MIRKILALLLAFQLQVTAVAQVSSASNSQEELRKNQETINSMLSKPGKPSSSVPIDGMNGMLYYDSNGVAKTIIGADGTSMSVSDFMNSKEFEAHVGTNESDSNSREEDTTPTGASNLVPENFNGDVAISTKKNADGSYNILSGIEDATGGPFDRKYNGVSGSVPVDPPLSDLEYNEKYLILTAQIWGVTEVAEKMCRPLDKDFPKSISSWWIVVKNYIESEKKRDSLAKERATLLKSTVASATTKAGGNSAIQLDAIKLQIESINIAIDSLSGSSLFSGDNKAGVARATSRLAWREALLAATYQGIEDSKVEDVKVVKVYNACNAGIEASAAVATKACARTKQVNCSGIEASSPFAKDCEGKDTTITVNDPVPGSCEMKNNNLPLMQKISMKDLATLYAINPIPSKEMNERLLRIGSFINKQVHVLFPKSNDSKFDWSTPLYVCGEQMMKPIKLNGVICPANASDKDYDKSKFQGLGKSDDIISEINHYTTNEQNPPSPASYINTNLHYQNSLNAAKEDKNNSNLSKESLSGIALQELWNYWATGPYSKNFNSGKALNAGLDLQKERAAADNVNKQYNVSDGKCSNPAVCNPGPAVVPSSSIYVASPKEVTANAKLFLAAMGISESSLDDTTRLFTGYWNISDLYFGQSNIRQTYFKYNQKLIGDLVLADRNKLAILLSDRQKLIEAYTQLKKMLDELKGGSKGSGSGQSNSIAAGTSGGSTVGMAAAQTALDAGTVLSAVPKTTSFNTASGAFDTASISALGKSSNGLLTFGSKNGTTAMSNGNNGKQYSIAQNNKINKNIANSKKLQKNIEDLSRKNRSLKLNDEDKSFKKMEAQASSNMKPNYIGTSGIAVLAALGNGMPVKPGEVSTSSDRISKSSRTADDIYTSDSSKNINPSNSESSSSSTSSNNNSIEESESKGTGLMGKNTNYANLTEDEKRIYEAIYARDKENKAKYIKKDSDSIFEQLTKAHIRSYERIQN